jgi:hypothetical protein
MARERDDSKVSELKAEIDRLRKQLDGYVGELRTLSSAPRTREGDESCDSTDGEHDSASSPQGAEDAFDVRKLFEQVRTTGKKFLDDLADETTRHPRTGLFIAFGIGCLTARLFRGGTKH